MNHRSNNFTRQLQSISLVDRFMSSSLITLDFDFAIRAVGGVLAIATLMYGYLVNQTVSITAEYRDVENRIIEASSRLAEASAQMVIIEEYIESLEAESYELSVQTEASGFVSRSANSGFTFNN